VYATATTIEAFARTGLEGQVGIFDDAGALITGALSAGDKFSFAQIRDSELRRSVELTYGDGNLAITKTPYDATVLQQNAVGYNGTTGSLNLNVVGGLQEFTVSVRDTTPGNQPFPVAEGRATIRSASVTEYSIVAAIVEDLMNSNDYERNSDIAFVTAEILSNAAQAAIGTATLAVLQGSTRVVYSAAHGLSVGDYIGILGVAYRVASVISTTQIEIDRAYAGTTQTALATGTTVATHGTLTYVDGTTELGIRLTAVSEDTNFVVSIGDDLVDADTSSLVAWKQGSGEDWQVSLIEDESIVFDGFTTGNYPFVQDFGKPTKFVNDGSGITYDLWILKYKKTTASMAFANEQAHHLGYVVLSAPASGDTPGGDYDTVLGT
jgi:hypothetical protein